VTIKRACVGITISKERKPRQEIDADRGGVVVPAAAYTTADWNYRRKTVAAQPNGMGRWEKVWPGKEGKWL
jgi:hypothetical protein